MKKFIIAFLTVLPMLTLAAGPSIKLDAANNDLRDKASLKRGFEAFINNCLACHQLQYQRYNRTFADLGISDEDGLANYMYTGEKVGDHITNTMPAKDAAKWFGGAPPEHALEALIGFTLTCDLFMLMKIVRLVSTIKFLKMWVCHMYYKIFKVLKQ
jgi:ubiquinol-cytochrome c reductase cytochrome c1 subunit